MSVLDSEPYSIYEWEPAALQYYPEAIDAESCWGQSYESLHVERTNEGYHALILEWEDLSDSDEEEFGDGYLYTDTEPCYVMLDEQVFPDKTSAKRWLMRRDVQRFRQEELGVAKEFA